MHTEDFEEYFKIIDTPEGQSNTSDKGMRFQTMRIIRTEDIGKGVWLPVWHS